MDFSGNLIITGKLVLKRVADVKYKESLTSCFRERFFGRPLGVHPSSAGVVAPDAKDSRAGKAS